MNRGARGLAVAIVLISIYVLLYAVLYSNRKPAGNLAYWVYTGEDMPDEVERILYYVFYPLYFVHQRAFHVGPHTWDRPEWVMPPPDFQG